MFGRVLLFVCLIAAFSVAVAQVEQEWMQPAFVESSADPIQPRVWQQSTAEHLGPVGEPEPRSLVSSESSVSVSAEARAQATLAATVTAEGKTAAEIQAEIEQRAPSLWDSFKSKFKKTYKDEKARFLTFTKNLLRIAGLNAKVAASKIPLGLRAIFSHDNANSDLSEAEFKKMLGVKNTKPVSPKVAPKAPKRVIRGKGASPIRKVFLELETEVGQDVAASDDGPVVVQAEAVDNLAEATKKAEAAKAAAAAAAVPPVDVDWRSISSPIRNQGSCGSCWAHSAVATLESAFALKTGIKLVLSPQQLLECDPISKGCAGGQAINALKWLAANGGAATENKIEYWGKSMGQCVLAKDAKVTGIRSWFGSSKPDPIPVPTNVEAAIPWCFFNCTPDENELGHQLSSSGVLSVNVDASHLQFYKSGVLDATSGCSSNPFSINHAVNLEGLGTDPVSKTRFWIVRNSWGDRWGEEGRFRLLFGANTCSVGSQPVKTSVLPLP